MSTSIKTSEIQLIDQVKQMVVEGLALKDVDPETINNSSPLFGEGLGLDSLDALELIMIMRKQLGITVVDKDEAELAFQSFNSLTAFIDSRRESARSAM